MGTPKNRNRENNGKRKANNNDSVRSSNDDNAKSSNKRRRRHNQSPPRKKLTQEALDLSRRLQELSRQKQLQQALDLYWSQRQQQQQQHVTDAFHACILIDCCARCGAVDEAEKIVADLGDKTVETQTALLKAFAHSGRMHSAIDLFRAMIEEKYRKPNVRTLNTLLRGCMWTGATRNNTGQVAGGVATSEEAWKLYMDNVGVSELDASSFEYSISLLCQALRCDDAQQRIQDYQSFAGVRVKGKASIIGGNQESLETIAVAYISLARAYALCGKMENMWEACQRVLNAIKRWRMLLMKETTMEDQSSEGRKKKEKVSGGKRAFKKSTEGNDNEMKRAASNQAYRNHRLKEAEAEALALIKLRKSAEASRLQKIVQRRLLCELLYFSGGGTTELSKTTPSQTEMRTNVSEDIFIPTWLSFGLSQLIDDDLRNKPFGSHTRTDVMKSLDVKSAKIVGKNGLIRFKDVFRNDKLPVDIELGAGFGDWITRQARVNTDRNYIAVELRADRVARIFAHGVLDSVEESSSSLGNLCIVGSEGGSFLRVRIQQASISTIYANHPEPPTQTYGYESTDLENIMQGGNEPAHMLNSVTIKAMAECLKPNGRIVIVTDNKWFARLLGATVVRAMSMNHTGLYSAQASELRGFRRIEIFGHGACKVELLEGQPNNSVGHVVYDPQTGGSSYFDRLWRSGAGSHADSRSRYLVVLNKRS